MINEIEYYRKLLQNDFVMPKIEPNNLLQNTDSDILSEIDRLTNTKSTHMIKNDSKNKIKRYNIPNVKIKRHSHIRQ